MVVRFSWFKLLDSDGFEWSL